jgi:hypothetical protein
MSLLAIDRQLPTELLHEIAEYLSTQGLVSLCRVSKLFNTVSTVLLYRGIVLVEPVETVLCCNTLRANVLAARSVRSCTILWYVLIYDSRTCILIPNSKQLLVPLLLGILSRHMLSSEPSARNHDTRPWFFNANSAFLPRRPPALLISKLAGPEPRHGAYPIGTSVYAAQ